MVKQPLVQPGTVVSTPFKIAQAAAKSNRQSLGWEDYVFADATIWRSPE